MDISIGENNTNNPDNLQNIIFNRIAEATPNKVVSNNHKIRIIDSEGNTKNIIKVQTLHDVEDCLEEGDTWEDLTDYSVLMRETRHIIFKKTIDRMTPIWWESLSEDQQNRIKAFRLALLDFPATGVVPFEFQIGTIINSENEEEAVMASTNVTDIFGVINLDTV